MNRKLRAICEVLFLLFFVFLVKTRQPMQWMKVFLVSAVLAVPFGRFYCGWICPIDTLMRVSDWVGKKIGLQTDRTPRALRSGALAYAMLLLTVLLAYLNLTRRVRLPFLVVMVAIGFLLTLRYKPAVWHRYLCPYGLILRIPGRFARLKMNVGSGCTGCRLCQKVCPGEAVTVAEKRATIDPQHCLVCLDCQAVCPTRAIAYSAGSSHDVKNRDATGDVATPAGSG